MSNFWAGVLLGFFAGIVASILANHYWEIRARYRAYKSALKLVGSWEAHKMKGRTVDSTPMPGAGLAVVSSKRRWWSVNSAVLDVSAQDIEVSTGHKRNHDGHIVMDQAIPWLATRIDRYDDSNEMSEQRLVISQDFNTVYVFPVTGIATIGDVYEKHAWLRKC